MNRPDFDKLTDRELRQAKADCNNMTARMYAQMMRKRIARAEQEIEQGVDNELIS